MTTIAAKVYDSRGQLRTNHFEDADFEDGKLGTMMLDQVRKLMAGDTSNRHTVEDSGPYLEAMYKGTQRYNFRTPSQPDGAQDRFWQKVHQVAALLLEADVWPFPPLNVWGDTLMDGHHRSNAAILVGWDKPIPVYGSNF